MELKFFSPPVLYSPLDLARLQNDAESSSMECIVDALIRDNEGMVFIKKRSPHLRLFPNCWDIVGGHVEVGEALYHALAREIIEETGWRLKKINYLLGVCDWRKQKDNSPQEMREFIFDVEIIGDFLQPRIELDKYSAWKWIDPSDRVFLENGKNPGDQFIIDIIEYVRRISSRD